MRRVVGLSPRCLRPTGSWGIRENGTWTGLLGALYTGQSDLAINYFTLTEDRAQDFDYSVTYYNEG